MHQNSGIEVITFRLYSVFYKIVCPGQEKKPKICCYFNNNLRFTCILLDKGYGVSYIG